MLKKKTTKQRLDELEEKTEVLMGIVVKQQGEISELKNPKKPQYFGD